MEKYRTRAVLRLAFIAVALAMGVVVIALNALDGMSPNTVSPTTQIVPLAIGLFVLAMASLPGSRPSA